MRAFWVMLFLAMAGFLDSAYLTMKHLSGTVPGCALTGCETVLTSKFASIGGFPTAGLGIIYYGFLIFLLVMLLDRRVKMFAFFATRLSVVGLFFSLAFVYVQLAVLGAICQYCMVSAFICLLNFLIAVRHWSLIFLTQK
jgi:uncharacterized membrane protein